jgi:salicylate hydroxylase
MAGQLHLSHRFVSYEETDKEIQLQFQDGKTASCDLLIGMDGIKSVVRKCFLIKQGLLDSPSIHPFWTGSFAYRGLVPIDKLEASFPGHRVFHTPMMVGHHYSSRQCHHSLCSLVVTSIVESPRFA